MVLRLLEKPGQNSRSLVVPHFVFMLVAPFLHNAQKLLSFRARITSLAIRKSSSHNPWGYPCFQMIFQLQATQQRSCWPDTSKIVFCFFVACLILQNTSNGSGLSECFDGPTTVTTVASRPGLRVLQQSIEDVNTHAGAGCETITSVSYTHLTLPTNREV